MKLIRIFSALVLSLALLSTAVGAEEFTASAERGEDIKFAVTTDDEGNKIIGQLFDENGEYERPILLEELIITPIWHLEDGAYEVHNEIEATLVAAEKELEVEDWQKIVTNFETEWTEVTGGAPVENAVVSDVFDVRYNSVVDGFLTKLLVEGKSATFDIVVDGITKDTLFVVGHKPSDTGVWVMEDYTISDDNVITISVDSLSQFFIAVDNGAAPVVANAPLSPQTGVEELAGGTETAAAAAGAALLCGLGFLCVRKFRKSSAQ